MTVNKLTAPHRQEQENNPDYRRLHDFAHAPVAKITTHEQGNRDCRPDGEDAPGTFCQRFDDDQRQNRQEQGHAVP
jgi:hypothetical protein